MRVDSVPFSKCADCACMLPTEGTLMVVLAAGAVSGHFIQFSKGTLASKYSASSHLRSVRKNIDAKHTVGRRILLDALKALQCRIQTLSSAIHYYFGQACKRCQMTVTGRSHTTIHQILYQSIAKTPSQVAAPSTNACSTTLRAPFLDTTTRRLPHAGCHPAV